MIEIEDDIRRVLREHAGTIDASPDLGERIERKLRRRARVRRLTSAVVAIAVIGGAALATWTVAFSGHPSTNVHTAAQPTSTEPVVGASAGPLEVPLGGWAVTAEPPFTEAFASVWTGTELIVAFRPGGNIRFATYNPTHNQWQTLPDPPITITAPFTDSSTFVWTGTTALVWAFQNTGPSTSDGHHRLLSYNPTTKQWARLADPPIDGLIQAHPIWTGRELIVWGGSGQPSTALGQGAAYDPARNHWRTIALGPLSSRENPMITWTGQEMIVWGGLTSSTDRLEGAAYNPATDTWRIMPRSGLPTLELAATAWTGHEMIVYGTPPAGGTLAGGAYNPTTNRWRNLLPAGQPGARDLPAWTWTGRQLIVWGGLQYIHGRQTVSDGAAYNPTDDQWTPLPFPPIAARHSALMAWTGQLAIILGGYGPSQLGASSEPPALHAAAYRP